MNPNEVIDAPAEKLREHASQPRGARSDESLLALGRTMVESGQIEPLLVFEEGGEFHILSGGRRFRAGRLAGITTFKVRVVPKPATLAEAIEMQLLANLTEPLGPLEYARCVAMLRRETGLSVGKAADRLGTSPASISRAERLCGMSARIQELVASEKLGADVAYQISLADPAKQEGLAEQAVRERLSRDAVAARVRGTRVGRAGKPKAASRAIAELGGGRQVTFIATGEINLTQVVEMAEDVLAKARKYRNRGVDLATFLAQLKLDAKASAGVHSEKEVQP